MSATETHLDRLAAVERRLYKKLSNIKKQKDQERAEVGHAGITWVPPGWGMAYWERGLRYRRDGGGEGTRYSELDPDTLEEMMSKFGEFSEFIRNRYGLDLEPPPKPPGPGPGHWIKMACSGKYRGDVRERAKIDTITAGLEKLTEARDEAATKMKELEVEEAELLKQGREAQSDVVRRRLVPRIAQKREEINRQGTIVKFAQGKMKACEVALHNTALTELNKIPGLPDSDDIVSTQVEAENAAADVEAALDAATAVDFDHASDVETAILKELEGEPAVEEEEENTAEAAEIMEEFKAEPEAEEEADAGEKKKVAEKAE